MLSFGFGFGFGVGFDFDFDFEVSVISILYCKEMPEPPHGQPTSRRNDQSPRSYAPPGVARQNRAQAHRAATTAAAPRRMASSALFIPIDPVATRKECEEVCVRL